mgnify:FL=1|tara:strand:- start:747 stop:1058 length:312 start_codon:yes stop_codon:yes gene_type:complete
MSKSNLSYQTLRGLAKQAAQNMGLFSNAVQVVLDCNSTRYENKDLYNVYINYSNKQPEKTLSSQSNITTYYYLLGLINGSQTKKDTLKIDNDFINRHIEVIKV